MSGWLHVSERSLISDAQFQGKLLVMLLDLLLRRAGRKAKNLERVIDGKLRKRRRMVEVVRQISKEGPAQKERKNTLSQALPVLDTSKPLHANSVVAAFCTCAQGLDRSVCGLDTKTTMIEHAGQGKRRSGEKTMQAARFRLKGDVSADAARNGGS